MLPKSLCGVRPYQSLRLQCMRVQAAGYGREQHCTPLLQMRHLDWHASSSNEDSPNCAMCCNSYILSSLQDTCCAIHAAFTLQEASQLAAPGEKFPKFCDLAHGPDSQCWLDQGCGDCGLRRH